MTLVKNVTANRLRLSDGSYLAAGAQQDLILGAYEVHHLRLGNMIEPGDPYKWLPATSPGGGEVDLSAYVGDVGVTGSITASQKVVGAEASAGKVQAGDAGITFGSAEDTKLYRSSANNLRTDSHFHSQYVLNGRVGTGNQVRVAASATSASIEFGIASDTNLYRNGADELKTDDSFVVGNQFTVNGGVIRVLQSGATRFRILGGTAEWSGDGSVFDTNLYRSAADTLKTDDNLAAASLQSSGVVNSNTWQTAYVGGAGRTTIGDPTNAGITLGSAQDTKLYRSAANALKTDGSLTAVGGISSSALLTSSVGGGNQVLLGANPPNISFGPASDAKLYREAAGVLGTDNDFKFKGAGKGIILTSPDGTVTKKLTIDDSGALVVA